MTNAEQACKEAWRKTKNDEKFWEPMNIDIAGTMILPSYRRGFDDGYDRGRADAMELPQVRAEELVLGKSYEAINKDGESRCCFAGMMKGGKTYVFFCGNPNEHLADEFSFRGPLRFREGK